MNRLRIEGIAQLFDDMERVFEPYTSPFRVKTYTLGALYDPERYELVERKDFADKRVKEKDKEIAELERNRESTAKYYEMRIAKLKEEREKLLTKNEKK